MKKRRKKKSKRVEPLHVIEPNAGGIDIGSTEIYIAVPHDRDSDPVRCFETFTEDLHHAAKWLKECGIESVAMESTGVYWIPIFQILETYEIEVVLVNARHVKNVPGRKTDVLDCQWLQYLHSVGLLRGSFRPPQEVCVVRSILRHRDNLVKMSATHTQHMHKALTQMNLQIHHVISDITGTTGLAILDAILAGERDPKKLAELKDRRIKADEATIEKSLVGDYRSEHLFTLQQSLKMYRFYRGMINDCDIEIEKYLEKFKSQIDSEISPPPPETAKRKKKQRNEPNFDLRTHMYRILGTDLIQITGVNVQTTHVIFTEIGPDVSKFPTGDNFASWLGLCPNNKITGGKVFSSKTKTCANRVANVLRLAAQSLWHSQSYLGIYFRRMRARHGAPKAITATAHKLARIIYHLIKYKEKFDESIFAIQEEQHKKRQLKRMKQQAHSMGFQLVPIELQG